MTFDVKQFNCKNVETEKHQTKPPKHTTNPILLCLWIHDNAARTAFAKWVGKLVWKAMSFCGPSLGIMTSFPFSFIPLINRAVGLLQQASLTCGFFFFLYKLDLYFGIQGLPVKGGGRKSLKAIKCFTNLSKLTLAQGHKEPVPSARAWEEVSFWADTTLHHGPHPQSQLHPCEVRGVLLAPTGCKSGTQSVLRRVMKTISIDGRKAASVHSEKEKTLCF